MKQLLLVALLFIAAIVSAQNSFRAIVKSQQEGELLAGTTAHVIGLDVSATADTNGLLTLNTIPNGEQTIEISLIGYFKKKIKITFPQPPNTAPLEVKLESQEAEMEEVVVVSTRTDKRQQENPMRVEVVGQDEMEERSTDKPSDISHAVKEQQGVQVQRTSATSGTFKIRLQGLDGKYVQVLKDGFPIYGGFASAIGIAQIPPLDLKQIEILKGPNSILYGGDAIAGVINLISKTPDEAHPEENIMLNVESTQSLDAAAYISQKKKWFGFTLLGIYRLQSAKDWNHDNFSDIPKLNRYGISPQLFFDLGKHANLNIGVDFMHENRLGGAMAYIQNRNDSVYNYFERNLSDHLGANLKFEYNFGEKGKLMLKNSINYFNRDLSLSYYAFGGQQWRSVNELSYHFTRGIHDLVVGADLRMDRFVEDSNSSELLRSYNFLTPGVFAQYTIQIKDAYLGAGARLDYNTQYKFFPLPHLAYLQKWNNYFTSRVNVGMGYKLPTIFQTESEERNFINVMPLGSNISPEWSLGGTVDLQVRLPNFNGVQITLSQLYFYTHIFRPLVHTETMIDTCVTLDCNQLTYSSGNGFSESRGVESNIKLSYRGFNTSLSYTFVDRYRKIDGISTAEPLTIRHAFSFLAGYEIYGTFTIGLDLYYNSPQLLSDYTLSHDFWEVGINTQLNLKYLLIFANLENILDIRQSNYEDIVKPYPTYNHPRFAEIWGPLEGTIFNFGIKLRFEEIWKQGQPKKDAD